MPGALVVEGDRVVLDNPALGTLGEGLGLVESLVEDDCTFVAEGAEENWWAYWKNQNQPRGYAPG